MKKIVKTFHDIMKIYMSINKYCEHGEEETLQYNCFEKVYLFFCLCCISLNIVLPDCTYRRGSKLTIEFWD